MSEEKKYINIEIGSRNIKLASEESDEYLRAIAKYLNQKMADITGGDLSHPLYRDDNAILFSLNIADDLRNIFTEIPYNSIEEVINETR